MQRFEAGGWWLPDGEEHLQQWMNTVNHRETGPGHGLGPGLRDETRLTYQYHKYSAALPFVKQRRLAVDVGAHVGLWSWVMARDFQRLEAFEPVVAHRDCWELNLQGQANAQLRPFALGESDGNVRVRSRTPGSSGDTGVDPVAERSSLRASVDSAGEKALLRRLDYFQLEEVDFIKIDCEGYELFVLRGAIDTLRRNKPCLIVEQKPETGMEERYGVTALDCIGFLAALGAKKRLCIQGDYIFSWD